jgi:hypothetical protein
MLATQITIKGKRTLSLSTRAGKIAESNKKEKWGESNLHPGPISMTREITSKASDIILSVRHPSFCT